MSGFINNLSPVQAAALAQVKSFLETNLNGRMRTVAQSQLNDPIILRFLRARKFDVNQSYDMLYNMLKFRIEFQGIGVDALHPRMCENELRTGKSYFFNYDKEGRPVCYIRSRLHDPSTTDPLENQRYTVLMMEYAKSLLRAPGETVTIIFDMSNTTTKNLDIKSVQFMINTLQNYYPESLGKVLVYNSTWIVNGVWKIIRPWLDPITAAKVVFIKEKELINFIPAESLVAEYPGGKNPYVYNVGTYRAEIAKLVESPRPMESTTLGEPGKVSPVQVLEPMGAAQ